MNYISTNWTPILYVFIILFFIFIILSFLFSRPPFEGMGLIAKIIYHPLEDTTGMMQYYKFEYNSETMSNLPTILNTAAPISQNTFDAILKTDLIGNNSVDSMIDSINSKVGNGCLKLDLSRRQYVELPPLIIPESGMTFTLWFNIQDNENIPTSGLMTLFDYSDFTANTFNYRIAAYYNISTKRLECITSFSQNNKRSVQIPNIVINNNTWNHFAWTMTPENGGGSTVYLNGRPIPNSILTSGFTYPSKDILHDGSNNSIPLFSNYIGKCVTPVFTHPSVTESYFNGYIDQFLVYNSEYTVEQIFTLYNSFSTMNPTREGMDSQYTDGLKYVIYNGYMNDRVDFVQTATVKTNNDLPVTGTVTEIKNITTGTNGFILPNQSLHTYTVEWTGFFKPDKPGNWIFSTNSDDCSFLWLGSVATTGYTQRNALVNNGNQHGMRTVYSTPIGLNQFEYYPIRIQFGENWGGHDMVVYFRHESDPINTFQTDGKGKYFS